MDIWIFDGHMNISWKYGWIYGYLRDIWIYGYFRDIWIFRDKWIF